MQQSFNHAYKSLVKGRHPSAFTLMELLVTISILAIVGGLLISQISLNKDAVQTDINKRSMGQVRDALLAFRMDMGYFPQQGALNDTHIKLSWVRDGKLIKSNKSIIKWNKNKFNFWQLFKQPESTIGDGRWDYLPSSGRGWNGPYLQQLGLRLHNTSKGFDNIYAIPDSFSSSSSEKSVQPDSEYWAIDSTAAATKYYPGNPYALLRQQQLFYLVSGGPDGVIQSKNEKLIYESDDIIITLGR